MSSNNVALSEQQQIKYAWELDTSFNFLFICVYAYMYLLSSVPSFVGFNFQMMAKTLTSTYLIFDVIIRAILVGSNKYDPKIWTYYNWLVYSVRRFVVDYMLTFLQFFTQLIPGWNWILNLIPLALSYYNFLGHW